ncbi:MAG: response regulator [Pseudomonadota bacterium]
MAELKPVLLVTSRFATLDFVHNTLTAPGRDYEVRTVASAEEAILALGRSSYSLLVSEQQLPGISGAEMALKAKEMEPMIPIVVIAADSEQRRQVTAADIESVYAVEQPLTEINLIDTVSAALRDSENVVNREPANARRDASPGQAPAAGGRIAEVTEASSPMDRERRDLGATPRPAEMNPIAQPLADLSKDSDTGRMSTQVGQKTNPADTSKPVDAPALQAMESPGGVSAAVRGRLELLHADTGARQVMLATMSADVLNVVGAPLPNGLEQMASAVAANMAGSFDLAEILDSVEPLAIHYQAGKEWELLCANVGKNLLLAILFAARAGRGQIGTAWIYTRRAVNDLGRLLADSAPDTVSEFPLDVEAGPGTESVPGRGAAGEAEPPESVPPAVEEAEDLDRFWDEALAGTTTGDEDSGAIRLEEARRLGLVPPDFDLDNQ